ncbi:MAG: hypothetical protein ABSA97_05740 [Verrucomicrobiia bacterium]
MKARFDFETLRRACACAACKGEANVIGDKSEAFCRQRLTVLAQNTGILPPNYNLAEAQADRQVCRYDCPAIQLRPPPT